MKTKTDLKAGIIGHCTIDYNKYGKCKKVVCNYPPYEFPCSQAYRATRYGPFYHDVPGEPVE